MPKFLVQGKYTKTDSEVEITLTAGDYLAAHKQAEQMGIAASAILPVDETETSSKSSAKPDAHKEKNADEDMAEYLDQIDDSDHVHVAKKKFRVTGYSQTGGAPAEETIVANDEMDALHKAQAMKIQVASIKPLKPAPVKREQAREPENKLDGSQKTYRLLVLLVMTILLLIAFVVWAPLMTKI